MSDKVEVIISAKDNASSAIEGVSRHLNNLGKEGRNTDSALSRLGSAAGGIATGLGAIGLVAGGVVTAGLTAAVKGASDFESGMSAVKAASGASAGELQQLSALALVLGSDIELAGVSATDAATAMTELAKGGVSVADQLGGATRGALLLASAGSIEVADAAAIATKAMNIFGLSGADVAHVADLLAAGANKSATDVGQLGAAFNQAAAVARAAGLDIETLTGTLAFLAQRGMEGSDAGTSLKTALLALQAPTDVAANLMRDLGIHVRDSSGEMLPLAAIADVLRERLSGLSAAQRDAALKTIFGNDAIRVGIALYEGGGAAIRQWTASVDDAGIAARTGQTLNDNLAGSLDQLQAAAQTAAIQVGGTFAPMVRTAADAVTTLIERVMASPEAQRALEELAAQGSAAIQALVAKVSDPEFQAQMRAWATAARDVADVLGPPLQAAVGWFNSLDEGGKRNVVMFGLVAGSAVHFRDELRTLKGVVEDVIGAFGRKEAAKRSLTGANDILAGSAGRTAAAMQAVRAAAAVAAPAVAEVAIVTGGAIAVVYAASEAASYYNDVTGTTARNERELIATRQAMAFAAEHGATAQNTHTEAFLRYLSALPGGVSGVGDLAGAWDRYLSATSLAGLSTEGLINALTGQQQAQQAVNRYLGEGVIAGESFNNTLSGLGSAALALGNSLPPVATGVSAVDQAMGQVTTQATAMGSGLLAAQNALAAVGAAASSTAGYSAIASAALIDLNTYGNAAQQGLNNAAGAALAAASALEQANTSIRLLNAEQGQLSGYLRTLQGEWDTLTAAVARQGGATADQQARINELAPAIEYLNATLGTNQANTVNATLAAVQNMQAISNSTAAAASYTTTLAGQSAGQRIATTVAGGHTGAIDTTTAALGTATGATTTYTAALQAVPTRVETTVTTPGVTEGTGNVNALTGAINNVPRFFTVTAQVDISGALAAINELNAHLPHSPAEKGPFSSLPNWEALFDSLPGAVDGAVGQVARFGGEVRAALGDLSLGEVARDLGGTGSGAIGALMRRFADDFAVAVEVMAATAAAAGEFATEARAYRDLVTIAVSLIREAQGLLNTINLGAGVPSIEGAGRGLGESLTRGIKRELDIHSPSRVMAGIGRDVVAGLVEGMTADQQAAARAAAEVASAVAAAVEATLKASTALGSLDVAALPGDAQVAGIVGFTRRLIDGVRDAAAAVATEAVAAAAQWAEGAGKVASFYATGAEAIGKIAAAVIPAESGIRGVSSSVRAMLADMAIIAEQVTIEAVDLAARAAGGATSVVELYGKGAAALSGLATYADPPRSAIYAFGKTLRAALDDLAIIAEQVTVEGSRLGGAFAEGATKAVGLYAAGAAGIKALQDYTDPPLTAVYAFGKVIRLVLNDMAIIAEQVTVDAADLAGRVAEGGGRVFALFGSGVSALVALRTYVDPPRSAVDALLATMRYVLDRFGAMAALMSEEGAKQSGAVGTAAGSIFGAAKSAIDAFAVLDETNMPTPGKVDDLVRAVGDVVGKVGALGAVLGEDTLKGATAVGQAAGGIFGALKSGLDLLIQIDKPGQWPLTDWLQPLIELMGGALGRGAVLLSQAEQLRATADRFAATLAGAASGFANGYANVANNTVLAGPGGGIVADVRASAGVVNPGGLGQGGPGGGGQTIVFQPGSIVVQGNAWTTRQLADELQSILAGKGRNNLSLGLGTSG